MFEIQKQWWSSTKKDFKDFLLRQQNFLFCIFLFFVLWYAGIYFLARNSEMYSMTEKFVRENQTLQEKLGGINYVSLDFDPAFRFTYTLDGAVGTANLEIRASGQNTNCKIFAYLSMKNGNWTLYKAYAVTAGLDAIQLK